MRYDIKEAEIKQTRRSTDEQYGCPVTHEKIMVTTITKKRAKSVSINGDTYEVSQADIALKADGEITGDEIEVTLRLRPAA